EGSARGQGGEPRAPHHFRIIMGIGGARRGGAIAPDVPTLPSGERIQNTPGSVATEERNNAPRSTSAGAEWGIARGVEIGTGVQTANWPFGMGVQTENSP
ncbi:MAG TPA: hypothetical protein VFS00_33310, partial [Polyangiaceae bacterium]|nr:hypothetical protein [Polyangiaceae bacterium]